MKEKQFDDFVKHSLQHHEVAVPQGIWQKIATENNKKRYGGFWWKSTTIWLLLAAFVFSALLSANYINQVKGKHLTANIKHKKTMLPDESAYLISLEPSATDYHTTANPATQNSTIPPVNAKTISTIIEPTTPYLVPASNTINKLQVLTKPATIKKVALRITPQNSAITVNNNNTDIHEKMYDANQLYNFTKLFTQNISWKKQQSNNLAALNKLKFSHDVNDCPEINKYTRNDWYIDGFTSAEYTMKKVQGNGNNTDYIQKKDSAERMAGGLTMGVRISKNIGENLVVRAGLQFSQIAEKINLIRESDRRVVTVITIRTVTDAGGNTITVADTTSTLQVNYTTLTTRNYYRNIELPVTLGYEWSNKNFKAQFNGGVIVNVASWYSGKILDSSYNLVAAASKENLTTHKQTIGLSVYGSIALIKPINERLEIFAEPYFRMNVSKPAQSPLGFTQQFSAAGIGFGARFKLNTSKD